MDFLGVLRFYAKKLQRKSLSFSEYAKFYSGLEEMLTGGVTIGDALSNATGWVKSEDKKQKMHRVKMYVEQGKALSEGMRASGLFPYFDCSLIEAAEPSGKLTDVLRKLSERYVEKELVFKMVLQKMAYPFFLIFAALFILNFPKLFTGDMSAGQYLKSTLGLIVLGLVVLYAVVSVISSLKRNPKYESLMSKLQNSIPLVGAIYKINALEEYFYSLYLLTEAGVNITEASRKASNVGSNLMIRQITGSVALRLKQGGELAASFQGHKLFDQEMLTYIKTSESTGNYSKAFQTISQKLLDRLKLRVNILAATLPKLIYLVVVIVIGYNIIQGFMSQPLFQDIQ